MEDGCFRKLPAPVLPGSGAKGLSQPRRPGMKIMPPVGEAPLFRRRSLDHKRRGARKPAVRRRCRDFDLAPSNEMSMRSGPAVWHNAVTGAEKTRRARHSWPHAWRRNHGGRRPRKINFRLRASRQNRAPVRTRVHRDGAMPGQVSQTRRSHGLAKGRLLAGSPDMGNQIGPVRRRNALRVSTSSGRS
ncbi:hypothetical protein QFZ94_006431 [Paraburkholderia sp. JPY465]